MALPSTVAISDIDSRSAEFDTYWREWRELDLLNVGGSQLRNAVGLDGSSILVKRPKEPQDVYAQRMARFTYQPILPNVVSWYAAKMFEKDPAITGLPGKNAFWDGFLKDCDRSGTSLRNFGADIFETAFVYSVAYVLTDLPPQEGSFDSLDEQQKAGVLDPYLTVFDPLSVCGYRMNRYGALDEIVLKTVTVDSTFGQKPKTVTEWRYFNRTEFAVYRAEKEGRGAGVWESAASAGSQDTEAEKVAEGSHSLAAFNRVPVRRINLRKPMRLARRVYSQLLDHVNQDNTYAWALFNANLAMPYFTGAGDMTPTLSEVGWYNLPQGATAGWLEPGGQTFDHAQKRLDSLRQEIYRSFHLQAQGRDSTATAAASSGFSKELDMAPAQDMLDSFGEFMRESMEGVLMDVADAHGDDSTKINVSWPRYDSTVALEEVALGEALDTIDIQSDTLYKIRDRRVAMAYMEDEPKEQKDIVAAEIEAAPGKGEREQAARDAQVQQFQNSLLTAGNRSLAKSDVQQEDAAVAAA